jgi:hypothetical protein
MKRREFLANSFAGFGAAGAAAVAFGAMGQQVDGWTRRRKVLFLPLGALPTVKASGTRIKMK